MIAAAGPAAPRIDRDALDPELRRVFATLRSTPPGDAGAAADAIAAALGGSAFGLAAEQGQYRIVLPDGGPVREIDVSRQHGDDIAADLARRDFTINALAAPLGEDGGLGEAAAPPRRWAPP